MDAETPRVSAEESKMASAKASHDHSVMSLAPPVPMEVVEFDGDDDPYNAQNWPAKKKMRVFALYSLMTASATFASTIYNSGILQVERRFNVNNTTALAGMSLYLFGNAFGPLAWAPMSETMGRKPSVVIPILGLGLFTFGAASAANIQTLLITRFFAGVCGGAPLSNAGGVLADIFPAAQRGPALLLWGLTITIGPLVAPIVGGGLVMAESTHGWRWTLYLTGILVTMSFFLSLLFIEESYAPVLLKRKAQRLRNETKNWSLHAKLEEGGTSFGEMASKYFILPFEMLVDPVALLMNLYAAFCYAIIYLAVPAVQYQFALVRHWNAIKSTIPFTAIIIGVIFGGVVLAAGAKKYAAKLVTSGGRPIPEARLFPMMVGSVFFAGGLFIMAWTSKPSMHWIGFCIGAACVGLGFFAVFQSALAYLIDVYLTQSASTLAANLFLRSILAGAFPLFAKALFDNLGMDWGLSLLGFIATAMLPIPWLFSFFGPKIRAVGKHSRKTYVP